MGFPELQQSVRDEGLPFSIVITLFEDTLGNRPPTEPEIAVEYAELVEIARELPVTVDLSGQLITSVPWEESLPGKCVVTREMEILHCWEAVDNEEGLSLIRADFEATR